tara:strand:- start:356 stop:880 length:525 start_codon:yes stop_codon:yes gene_type:complete
MSNLRLIQVDDITSTVSTFDISNVFSADFDVYEMIFSGITTDTTDQVFSGRFINSSGVVDTGTNYDYAVHEMKSNTSFGSDIGTGQDDMQSLIGRQGDSTASMGCVVRIFNPFITTSFTFAQSQFTGMSGTDMRTFKGVFRHNVETTVTGLQIRNNNNNFTGGKIITYGMRVDT